MFWDGRATGWTLGDPLAEQALGPFLNPLEQNNASAQVVVDKVLASVVYATSSRRSVGIPPTPDEYHGYVCIGRAIAVLREIQ